VCNTDSIMMKYGVYLCGEKCQNLWRFAEDDLEARRNFREALRLSGGSLA
jgi:hypothetical protein